MVRSGQAATMGGGPRKRSIRRRISANSALGTATSASWKTTYRPCRTIRAPIFTSFSRKVVSDHCSTSCAEAGEEDLRLVRRPADGPGQQVPMEDMLQYK